METLTSINDLKATFGQNKKGNWTLAIATGADGKTYKTFNEALQGQLKGLVASGQSVEIVFEENKRSYTDGQGKERSAVDREIKELRQKDGPAPAASHSSKPPANGAAPRGPAQMPAEYWEKKQVQEFRRTASMSALKSCAELMAACINANVESYKFDEAVEITKVKARELFRDYFKPLEGGEPNGSVASDQEHPNVQA